MLKIKKIICLSLVVMMLAAGAVSVNATDGKITFQGIDDDGNIYELPRAIVSTVLVNGVAHEFDSFLIMDNNFFKLRDLAYVLSGTEKQFDVGFDNETSTVILTTGLPYTLIGGEMAGRHMGYVGKNVQYSGRPSMHRILLDGVEISLSAYNMVDNNYFRLRDMGYALDFFVDWDGSNVIIDTSRGFYGPAPDSFTKRDVITDRIEDWQERIARSNNVWDFLENVPLSELELILGSTRVVTDVFDFGYGIMYISPESRATMPFDEDGIFIASTFYTDNGWIFAVLKRGENDSLIGMLYRLPAELAAQVPSL